MEKYLITGFSGFVGHHFMNYLESKGVQASVLGLDIQPPQTDYTKDFKFVNQTFMELDLLDKEKLQYIIYNYQPDYLLHLASFSSVAYSWQNPVLSFQNNINIFLNLVESIHQSKINCRILSIGSSEEYGNINEDRLPLKEDCQLDPVSPYAVARVSQELLSNVYVKGYKLDIILTRSFNHIGPGQNERFVIPSFVKQLVKMHKGLSSDNELVVGDTSIIRDFTDVRDVVRAYYMLLKNGKSGEIYNICSGKGRSLSEIIEVIAKTLGIVVKQKVNPELIRPNDNKKIIGSYDKVKHEIGWSPEFSLEATLQDLISEWKIKL